MLKKEKGVKALIFKVLSRIRKKAVCKIERLLNFQKEGDKILIKYYNNTTNYKGFCHVR